MWEWHLSMLKTSMQLEMNVKVFINKMKRYLGFALKYPIKIKIWVNSDKWKMLKINYDCWLWVMGTLKFSIKYYILYFCVNDLEVPIKERFLNLLK